MKSAMTEISMLPVFFFQMTNAINYCRLCIADWFGTIARYTCVCSNQYTFVYRTNNSKLHIVIFISHKHEYVHNRNSLKVFWHILISKLILFNVCIITIINGLTNKKHIAYCKLAKKCSHFSSSCMTF